MATTEVLVVGAGPTGLALACGLLQQGVDVRVVDRATGPSTTSRANGLHARGAEVLDRVGALADLPERALPALQIGMHLNGERLTTVRFGEIEGKNVSALFLSQALIEEALRRRLEELGGVVEWNAELVDAVQDSGGVTATFSGDDTVRARWLAGCDGAHSAVRKAVGIGFPGAALPDQWLLADARAELCGDRSGSLGWIDGRGILAAMPMPGGDVWRFMTSVPHSEGEDPGPQEILEHFDRQFAERTKLSGVRLRDPLWTSTFRIHRRLADDYRRGRVLLAGDAAHIHSPLGGQGMNTGIGDAENLAWKLALVVRGRADESLVDTYSAERRPLAAGVLRGTSTSTRMVLVRGPVLRLLRDRVLVPLLSRPAVQRRLTNTASQLWVHYRKGPLGSRFGRGLRPGDRVPDVSCRRSDGTPTRLHAELRGRWVLLGSFEDGPASLASEALGQRVTTLVPEDGNTRELRLIRPDGHLAWRGRSNSSGLRRWLQAALGTAVGTAPRREVAA